VLVGPPSQRTGNTFSTTIGMSSYLSRNLDVDIGRTNRENSHFIPPTSSEEELILSQKVHREKGSNMDYALRFLAGGLIVSAFAILGDLLRPKSFAGLFGAAPSVALATLTLALVEKTPSFIATEARSMVLGAIALLIYSFATCQLLARFRTSAVAATLSALAVWLFTAFGLEQLILR
jgi:hypothetical protein